jgi:hypothetical protein
LAALALLAIAAPGGGATPVQDRPALSPISAEFNGTIAQSTTYRVAISRPPSAVEWTWELEPPTDDPNCNRLLVISEEDARSAAEWLHGDGDGCRHLGTEHAGRITVFAKTGDYECSATITGSSTHTGPEPQPCFRKPTATPPPPKATTPPVILKPEAKEWKDTAAVMFAGTSAFSGLAIACALVPSPDPVTKGCAGVMFVIAAAHFAYGQYALWKSKDPPDKNFKVLAKLVMPKLPKARAGNGVTPAMAAAANAILTNVERVSANDAAFITSLERAQGAYAAKDGTWDRKQSRAAAGFARAEAMLLSAQPKLDATMKRAVAKAGAPPLTVADARRATSSVRKNGLPPSFTSLAHRLALPHSEVAAQEKRVAALPVGAIAGQVALKLGTPSVARAHRTASKLLRALAKRLDKR